MHIRQVRQKACGQISQSCKKNAPNAAERLDIRIGAMGYRIATKQIGHKRKLMGGKTRQRYTRKCQGINPDVAYAHPALHRFDKGSIERRVMSDNRTSSDKILQRRYRFFGTRRAGYVGIGDTRQSRNFRRYGATRMNEGVKPLHHLATAHAGCRYFNQLVILQRKTGRLGIENDYIIFYQSKRTRFRAIGERLVCFDHIIGSTG